MIFTGIDAGSRAVKVVLWDNERKKIVAKGISDQGVKQNEIVETLYYRILNDNKLEHDSTTNIIATGYGRNIVTLAQKTVTEITCHARGVISLIPKARTIIDIGGQDSKVISINEKGAVQDFMMNDKCAAGTGRFIEVAAERLGLKMKHIGNTARKSTTPCSISSMCVVFAETEIIGLLASGTPIEDIIAGVLKSIVSRVVSMGGRLIKPPIVFTGGVALVSGMKEILEASLKERVIIPECPQFTGALGAAIIAAEKN